MPQLWCLSINASALMPQLWRFIFDDSSLMTSSLIPSILMIHLWWNHLWWLISTLHQRTELILMSNLCYKLITRTQHDLAAWSPTNPHPQVRPAARMKNIYIYYKSFIFISYLNISKNFFSNILWVIHFYFILKHFY